MQNRLKKKHWLVKILSIYAILMFLSMPILELVSKLAEAKYDSLIELQENLEQEIEDTFDEKDNMDKEVRITSTISSDIFNISILETSGCFFRMNNIANKVLTPPPERC